MKEKEFYEEFEKLTPAQQTEIAGLVETVSRRDEAVRALLHVMVDLIPAERLSAAETCMKLMVQYR